MPKNEVADTQESAEFDLKHRVTGAAILLFLGALVLPWMLGPPSEANKSDENQEPVSVTEVEPANIITDPIRDLEDAVDNVEETVYISKITPLDANTPRSEPEAEKDDKKATKSSSESETPSNDVEVSTTLEALANEEQAKLDAQAEQERALSEKTKADEKAKKLLAEKEASEKQKKERAAKLKAEQDRAKQERELQAALAEETKTIASTASKVDVGWVVQVGLFTEKSRAVSLIDELKAKGFNASSSVVDTNRGVNTGTRVWLGPFAKRASAIDEQKRLKSKASKDGFIRVYP